MTQESRGILQRIDTQVRHEFSRPAKKINEGEDVSFFLRSRGYADLMTFLFQLNASMFPSKEASKAQPWEIGDSRIQFSSAVQNLRLLLDRLRSLTDQAPPDTGPRRFGNVSFRKWYALVEDSLPRLLTEYLPKEVLHFDKSSETSPEDEIKSYLLGSFGSAQRLDYGSGHELSFVAFLGCLWKLGGFAEADWGVEERGIVLGVVQPYLDLIRHLILTYTLEPAGSHGVWGLDDHSFVPYIFGSAQYSPPISKPEEIQLEGSIKDAPEPGSITNKSVVERERKRNMYFSAIGFIYDVKKGPFWEHSPILFDISGVKAGWAKINKGMLKMYNAEVLSKFPVVQHFPFGSLFRWEEDPDLPPQPVSVHTTNQPKRGPMTGVEAASGGVSTRVPQASTQAPWAGASTQASSSTTAAPWANLPSRGTSAATSGSNVTAAPWARQPPTTMPPTGTNRAPPMTARPGAPSMPAPTGAPWARPPNQDRSDRG